MLDILNKQVPFIRFLVMLIGAFYLGIVFPQVFWEFLQGMLVVATILGMIAFLFFYKESLSPQDVRINFIKFSEKTTYLFRGQLGIIICLFLIFYFIGMQMNLNPRIDNLPKAELVLRLQAHPVRLAIIPWFLLSIVGIIVGYFAVHRKDLPFLESYPMRWLHHNILWPILHASWFLQVAVILTMITALLADSLGMMFGSQSLFQLPLRLLFICVVIIFTYRNSFKRILTWSIKNKVSLGSMLYGYVVIYAVLIAALHVGLDLFLPEDINAKFNTNNRSELLNQYLTNAMDARIDMLIWGPLISLGSCWLVICIAHHAINQNIFLTLLQANILPLTLFYFILPKIDGDDIEIFFLWLRKPYLQVILALGTIFLIKKPLDNVHDFSDLARISLIPFGRFKKNSVGNVFRMMINSTSFYIMGVFFLGWLPELMVISASALYFILILSATVLLFIYYVVLPKVMRILTA